jgi:ATP-binding cassette, subfamily B, bacterial MsbA
MEPDTAPDTAPAADTPSPNPTKWIRSRFQIQSASLWRLMRLLRPYRTQIIMANLLAALSTSMAGFCLLALHPLFQVAMTPQEGERSPSAFVSENFRLPLGGGATNEPESPAGVGAPSGEPEEGMVAAKFRSLRRFVGRSESLGPTLTGWIDRAEAQWDRFSAWARVSPTRLITLYIIFIVFLYFLSQVFIFGSDYVMGRMTLNVTMGIMREAYGNVLNQEFNYFSSNTTGALLNVCYRQVMQLRSIIRFLVSTRFMIPINMLIMFGVLMAISFKLSMLLLAFLPLVILPALALVRRMKKSLSQEISEEGSTMEVMTEGLHGILAVKAFGAEALEKENLEPSIQQYVRMNRKRQAAMSMMGPMVDFMNMMVILLVFILVMVVLRQSLQLDQGRVVLFLFAVTRFHKPLRSMLTMNLQMQRSVQVTNRIFELLDRQPTIRDTPDAVGFPHDWRSIRFEDVSLIYFARPKPTPEEIQRKQQLRAEAAKRQRHKPPTEAERIRLEKLIKKRQQRQQKERPALLHVDLEIHRGEKIALIGPNGSGKSSLVNLLCRLYDPTDGTVSVDHVNFKDIRISDLREHICLVTQHAVLFNRTIRENIAFGLEGLTDDEVTAAARATGAHDFVSRLPNGYNTIIGEGGRHLSGGERQKIALARAFVRKPDILILDEPTTGLDQETTREFMELVFNERHRHLTIVFITHEATQLQHFQRILRVTPDHNIVDVVPEEVPPADVDHEHLARHQHTA